MPSTSIPNSTPTDSYRWLDPWVEEYLDGAITLTVTGISSTEEFLALVGAQLVSGEREAMPGGIRALADGGTNDRLLVGVMTAPGKPDWVLGAESPGAVSYERAGELSGPGGIAVAFHCNEESGAYFVWAEGGDVLADLSPSDGDVLDGNDPQRLVEIMRQTGLVSSFATHPCATAAALLEVITGVVITRQVLAEGEFTCGTVRFPYW